MAQTLEEFLKQDGFCQLLDQSILFKKEIEQKIEFVQITRMTYDHHAEPSDYMRKNQQIMFQYGEMGKSIQILNLILVPNMNCPSIKEVAEQVENVWILEEGKKRLVLFENQTRDFGGLYSKLEGWLQEDRKEGQMDLRNCPITIGLILCNILVYFIVSRFGDVFDTKFMLNMGAANWQCIFEEHEFYRLFTCMFLHFGLGHLLNNMLVLLLAGEQLEQVFSRISYLVLYLCSGLIASLTSAIANAISHENVVSAGASGAIYGLIGAIVIRIILDRELRRQFSFVRGFLLLVGTVYLTMRDTSVDQFAHGGGFVAGAVIGAFLLYTQRKKNLAQEKLFD